MDGVDPERDRRRGVGAVARRVRRQPGPRAPTRRPGSRSWTGPTPSAHWDTDPDAAAPGIIGPEPACRASSATTTSHNGNDSHWLSNPARAADRLRPDHRRRGDRALAAHPDRPAPGPGADRRRPTASGAPASASSQLQRRRARQPPVRGRAVARRAGRAVRVEPDADRLERAGGRLRGLPGRSRPGTSATTSTRPARSSSAASSRTCSPTSSSCRPASRAACTRART